MIVGIEKERWTPWSTFVFEKCINVRQKTKWPEGMIFSGAFGENCKKVKN